MEHWYSLLLLIQGVLIQSTLVNMGALIQSTLVNIGSTDTIYSC